MPRRRPRKIITRVIVFLLLGAIVNVAVAWGCARWVNISRDNSDTFGWKDVMHNHPIQTWTILGMRRTGACRVISERNWNATLASEIDSPPNDFLPMWCTRLFDQHYAKNESMAIIADARGWPLLSLCALGNHDAMTISFGIPLNDNATSWYYSKFALPLRPIWPGFAINTIFYAAVLWVLFAVPGAARRRVRIKRGQCASCGYSLRGSVSNACPECGATK